MAVRMGRTPCVAARYVAHSSKSGRESRRVSSAWRTPQSRTLDAETRLAAASLLRPAVPDSSVTVVVIGAGAVVFYACDPVFLQRKETRL